MFPPKLSPTSRSIKSWGECYPNLIRGLGSHQATYRHRRGNQDEPSRTGLSSSFGRTTASPRQRITSTSTYTRTFSTIRSRRNSLRGGGIGEIDGTEQLSADFGTTRTTAGTTESECSTFRSREYQDSEGRGTGG